MFSVSVAFNVCSCNQARNSPTLHGLFSYLDVSYTLYLAIIYWDFFNLYIIMIMILLLFCCSCG